MFEKFANIFRIPDLRKRILFTLGLLAVYRLGGHIPTPGVNAVGPNGQSRPVGKGSELQTGEIIDTGSGRYPQCGSARLSARASATIGDADACDPCADMVTADQKFPNAMFRVEIVRVDGDANNPTRLALAC